MGIRQGVRSRCPQPVSLCCRATSVKSRPYMQPFLFFFFLLSSCQLPTCTSPPLPMCWTKRPVLSPGNTGCDTVCMRLAVGLAGGSRLECCRCFAAGDEAAAAGIGCAQTRVHWGSLARSLTHTFLAGISSRAMQDASLLGASGRVPWGCPGIGWAQVRRTNSVRRQRRSRL